MRIRTPKDILVSNHRQPCHPSNKLANSEYLCGASVGLIPDPGVLNSRVKQLDRSRGLSIPPFGGYLD
jgi:hypothetical protein